MSEAQQLQLFWKKYIYFFLQTQEKRYKMHKGTSQYLSIISYWVIPCLSHLLVWKSNQSIYMNIQGMALKLNGQIVVFKSMSCPCYASLKCPLSQILHVLVCPFPLCLCSNDSHPIAGLQLKVSTSFWDVRIHRPLKLACHLSFWHSNHSCSSIHWVQN